MVACIALHSAAMRAEAAARTEDIDEDQMIWEYIREGMQGEPHVQREHAGLQVSDDTAAEAAQALRFRETLKETLLLHLEQ